MKKIFFIILLAVMITFTNSCKKFLDVNHSPNTTEEATLNLVYPAGTVSACYVLGGQYFLLGSVWSQHWTSAPNAPQYQAVDSYNLNVGDYDGRAWSELYSGALMDYEWVRIEAAKEENWTYYLMATVMQSYVYQILVDLYSDIPFTDALQWDLPEGEVVHPPVWDNGQDVYDSLIIRLDYALSKDLEAGTCDEIGNEDIFFSGNMEDWIKFANTLKLKIYMRQVYARPDVAQAGISKLYADGASFLNKDVTMTQFTEAVDHSNPIFETEWKNYGNKNIVASRTLLKFLDENSDPRLDKIYRTSASEHLGMIQGDYREEAIDNDQDAVFSRPFLLATTPVCVMTFSESLFLQAEAALRGWGDGNDNLLFAQAITQDAISRGIADTVITHGFDYVLNSYSSDLTEEEKLEIMMVQKWVALALKLPLEAFFEHNRTGYPREMGVQATDERYIADAGTYDVSGYFVVSQTSVLAPPVLYPKRLLYPSSETTNNPNTPSVVPLNTKVWWDTKVSPYVIN